MDILRKNFLINSINVVKVGCKDSRLFFGLFSEVEMFEDKTNPLLQ